MTSLLADVLAYCDQHPTWPLPYFGELALQRHDDGTLTVLGDAPEVICVTGALLDDADPQYLAFETDTLVINVSPEPLRYRPLGPDRYRQTVVFERVRDKDGD